MILFATQGDKMEGRNTSIYLEDRAVGTSEGIYWNMKCISLTVIIIANILHTFHLGKHQHLMDWVPSFLRQHSRFAKFNKLWVLMPPYPGFAQFNKPYCQVTQWSGEKIRTLSCAIVPVFAVTLLNLSASQRIPCTEALLCIKILEYFHLVACYWYHPEATIEDM